MSPEFAQKWKAQGKGKSQGVLLTEVQPEAGLPSENVPTPEERIAPEAEAAPITHEGGSNHRRLYDGRTGRVVESISKR